MHALPLGRRGAGFLMQIYDLTNVQPVSHYPQSLTNRVFMCEHMQLTLRSVLSNAVGRPMTQGF
jgi:hypothetical protein